MLTRDVGKASDKVAALEKAGALVTDSPAKIGETMKTVNHFFWTKDEQTFDRFIFIFL